MDYTEAEFFTLIDTIEAAGGQHLDETCQQFPQYEYVGIASAPHALPALRNCGNQSLFEIPYMAPDDAVQPITVCAVDDALGRWPRFGGDQYAALRYFIAPTK